MLRSYEKFIGSISALNFYEQEIVRTSHNLITAITCDKFARDLKNSTAKIHDYLIPFEISY